MLHAGIARLRSHNGTLRDAILYSIGANADHGQRRHRRSLAPCSSERTYTDRHGTVVADFKQMLPVGSV